jgi:hypothetical protein
MPFADSGFAGTTMSQLTLAAVVVALLVAVGAPLPPPLGHGAGDGGLAVVVALVPVAVDVGATVPVAVDVGTAVPVVPVVVVAVPAAVGVAVAVPAVGDAVPGPWWWPPAAAGCTNATAEAQLASAELLTCVVKLSVATTIAPTTRVSATGMAMVRAIRRRARLSCRRRHADPCLLGMQSTSKSWGDVLFFVARGCAAPAKSRVETVDLT